MTWKRIVAALVVAATLGYFAFIEIAGPTVEVARVARRDIVQTVVASGRVAKPHRVDIGAQVTATVTRVPVAEGAKVKAGQLLIVLESKEGQAAERQAQATLANAASQYERNRALHQKGFIGAAALDDAKRNFDVSRTQLDAARAKLDYLEIRAPVDGTLIARDVERGETVQPGKTLMVLSPGGATQLVLQIDERNLGRLKIGQQALASADAFPAQRFGATVAYINPGVDAQRGTVEVKLDIPQPPDYLRDDMTVSVDIETERHRGVLVLPANAVHDVAGTPYVLVVRGARAERQAVKLGLRGEAAVEVLDGVAEGEATVLNTNAAFKPGRRVRVAAQ
jgi:HlyD family secretion protein